MTYKPCWRLTHMPTREQAADALRRLGILSHYDLVQCRHCGEWTWTRRPDWSES